MGVDVFPVARVIDRLATEVPALRQVSGAAGLTAAEKQKPDSMPAAYVIASESGDAPKGYSGGTMVQAMTVTCVVVLFVEQPSHAASGSAAQLEMDRIKGLVRAALLNWKPMPSGTALHFVTDDQEQFAAGSQQAQVAYRMTYTLQQGANP